jgi:hypothetical protein
MFHCPNPSQFFARPVSIRADNCRLTRLAGSFDRGRTSGFNLIHSTNSDRVDSFWFKLGAPAFQARLIHSVDR